MAAAPPAIPPVVPSAPPAPYVLLTGNNEVPAGISRNDSMLQILFWIGFMLALQCAAIVQESIDSYESIFSLVQRISQIWLQPLALVV